MEFTQVQKRIVIDIMVRKYGFDVIKTFDDVDFDKAISILMTTGDLDQNFLTTNDKHIDGGYNEY